MCPAFACRQDGWQFVVLRDCRQVGRPWPGRQQLVVGEHRVELHSQADVLARHQLVVPGGLGKANRAFPVLEELLGALQRQVRMP